MSPQSPGQPSRTPPGEPWLGPEALEAPGLYAAMVLGPDAYSLSPSDVAIIFDGWGDGLIWPVNEIVNWIEYLWNTIRNTLHDWVQVPLGNLFTWVTDRLRDIRDWITNWLGPLLNSLFGNLMSWINSFIGGLWGWLIGAVGGITSYIAGRIGDLWGWLIGAVNGIRSYIGDRLGDLGRLIGDQLGAWGRAIGDQLGVWGRAIGDQLGVWGRWIGDRLGEWGRWIGDRLGEWGRTIGDWFGQVGTWVINARDAVTGFVQEHVIDPLGDWLGQIWAAITNFWNWLRSGLGNLLRQIGTWLSQLWNSQLIQSLIASARNFLGWIWGLIQGVGGAIWGLIGSRVPRGPGGAPSAIAGALATTGTLAFSLAAAKITGQAVLPWISGLDRSITTAVKEVSDFQEVNSRWIRPMFDAYLGQPTYYYFNNLFRNRLPSPSELIGLVGEHAISRQDYMETIGYYGIPPEWAEVLIELADRPVPLFRLVDMAMFRFSPPEFVAGELRNASYNNTAIPVLQAYISQQALLEGAGRGLSSLLSLYKDGFLSESQLTGQLAGLGYGERAVQGFIIGARWQETADWYADYITAFKDAYNKDVISEAELRARLAQTGMATRRIDNFVLRENMRKMPAPIRLRAEPPKPLYQQPPGALEVRALTLSYENDLIDRSAFRDSLARLQMPVDLIAATVDLADARKQVADLRGVKPPIPPYETDEGRLRVRTLVLLYRKEEISEAALAAGLRSLVMPAPLVDATVANARAAAIVPERDGELPIPHFVANSPQAILLANSRIAYRRAELDPDQFGDILIDLGYRPEDARAIIDAEDLIRQEPVPEEPPIIPPFEPRSPQAILFTNARTAFRQGVMTEVELVDILIYLGYRPEDARAIVAADSFIRRPAAIAA